MVALSVIALWVAFLPGGATTTEDAACQELLRAFSQCVSYNDAELCEQIGADSYPRCLLLEAEHRNDPADQIEALKRLSSLSGSVKTEIYGVIQTDGRLLAAATAIIRHLIGTGTVRRAVVTSAARTASQQAELIRSGNRYAAEASCHSLGLAADISVSGHRNLDVVAAAARTALIGKFGPDNRYIRIVKEELIGVLHIQPTFTGGGYRQILNSRIKALIAAGILPAGISTDKIPPYYRFKDARITVPHKAKNSQKKNDKRRKKK
ncbi:MAG TPA: DUF5715 family protein [bacterium]|nr:DUF5715 family protein [bacterium]